MTTVTILPEMADSYRALAGEKQSTGCPAGEAQDALTMQLAAEESGPLIIVQKHKADLFFTGAQQARRADLMRCRKAGALAPAETQELESLMEAELNGARQRTAVVLAELKP